MLGVRQSHMIFFNRFGSHRSIQADQIKFFFFNQCPCFRGQVTARVMTIKYRFAIFFANINQAFFTLIMVGRNRDNIPAAGLDMVTAMCYMKDRADRRDEGSKGRGKEAGGHDRLY